MTPEDRARLRRLAQVFENCSNLRLDPSNVEEFYDTFENERIRTSALDAIALWSLLQEPTCLLCEAQRDADFWPEVDEGKGMELGPDAGSVLCSACRSYPTGRKEASRDR